MMETILNIFDYMIDMLSYIDFSDIYSILVNVYELITGLI